MPIYEYQCASCRRKSSIFVRSVSSEVNPVCAHCGSTQMHRAISGFAFHRSLQSRQEAAGDARNPNESFWDDPANVGRWTEERAAEMGVELPVEIKEMIQAAREGEKPVPPSYGGADFPDPLREL